jgi:hypothetical protein
VLAPVPELVPAPALVPAPDAPADSPLDPAWLPLEPDEPELGEPGSEAPEEASEDPLGFVSGEVPVCAWDSVCEEPPELPSWPPDPGGVVLDGVSEDPPEEDAGALGEAGSVELPDPVSVPVGGVVSLAVAAGAPSVAVVEASEEDDSALAIVTGSSASQTTAASSPAQSQAVERHFPAVPAVVLIITALP